MNAQQLIRSAEQRLMTEAHKGWKEASPSELHNAISGAAMEAVAPLWKKKEDQRFPRRKAAYLSMEFLVGRLVYNNLYCMGLLDDCKKEWIRPFWKISRMTLLAMAGWAVWLPASWTVPSPAMFPSPVTGFASATASSGKPLWMAVSVRNRMTGRVSGIPGLSAVKMKLWLFP